MDKTIDRNKIKNFLALFLSVMVLFLIGYKDFKIKQIQRIQDISNLNTINEKNISPKGLFLESWQIIKNNYYEQNYRYWLW